MTLSTQTVLEYGFEATLDIINQGFSDYMVPIHLDRAGFQRMLRLDSIDVTLSKVVFRDGECVGAGLIAHRGWSSRLAAMAIIPTARRSGAGKWLLDQLMENAQNRGDQRMELEVILGNDPAIQLYQNAGFQTIRRLLSFKQLNPLGESHNFEKSDIREIAKLVASNGLPKLPWQLSSETLAQFGPPSQGCQLDSAWAVITSPEQSVIQLQSLIVDPALRGQGRATSLLRALFARYPNKTWQVPALFPEEMGPVFESVGFEHSKASPITYGIGFKKLSALRIGVVGVEVGLLGWLKHQNSPK